MHKIVPAKRTESVKHANRDVVPIAKALEKKGKKIIYLNIGDPNKFGYRTPEHIWNYINENRLRAETYSDATGSEKAREAIAQYAKKTGAKNVNKEDVINFVGGSEAIIMTLQALLNEGENILTPKPGYSVYLGELNFLNCPQNNYNLLEEEEWRADVDEIRKNITEKTKGIITINPNNPTGGLLSKKNLKEIIGVAGEYSLPVFCDETYDQIIFEEEKFHSIASLANDVPVISLGSISKTFLAPGFRGGWIYKQDPENKMDDYFEAIKKMCRLRLSNVGVAQLAIEAALTQPHETQGFVKDLEQKRNLTHKRINEIPGLSSTKPKGAFYCFPKIELPIKTDKDFCMQLLEETGVLVVFGEGFGQKEGTNHFRIVFLPPEEQLNEAMDKIETFVKKIDKEKNI